MVDANETAQPHCILIAVFGSRGNVFPLLAVGREMQRRGHPVSFATTERYRGDVLDAGMTYHALRPDPLPPPGETLSDPGKGDSESGLRGVVFPRVEETYRDLMAAGEDADVMIFPMFIFPGPMAAERLGIPWIEVHFTPGTFNSIYDPPYLPPLPWLYPLQRFTSLVPQLFNPIARLAVRPWHEPLYALRAREGFAHDKRTPLLGGLRSPWLTLALFSPCLGTAQRDWPKPNLTTGFPFYEEASGKENAAVEKFLDAGSAPIVAALGSVALEDRYKFFKDTIAAAERLERRLILIAGQDSASLLAENLPPSVLVVDYAPYSLVFPRACAVIISGSVGPISHALRSRRPILIVPAASKADQPDNALRAGRLGVARWLMLGGYDAATAVGHLQELLGDPAYQASADRVGAQVAAEDGVVRACDAVAEFLTSRS